MRGETCGFLSIFIFIREGLSMSLICSKYMGENESKMNYKNILFILFQPLILYTYLSFLFLCGVFKKKLIIGISPKIGILLSIFCCIDF